MRTLNERRYNLQNKYWHEENGVYELHFTHFYNDEVIIKFVQDKDDPETFWFVSDFLNVESDCINTDSIEDAKEEFEEKVEEYIEDQIAYYEEMLERFKEE